MFILFPPWTSYATSQEFFMNPCRASRDATPCWHDTVEIQMMKKGPSDVGIFLFYPSKVELAVGVHKIQTCNAVCHRVFRFPTLSSISSAYSIPGRNLMPRLLSPGQSCLGVHPGDLFRQSIDSVFHFLRDFIILWVFICDNDTLGSTYACTLQVAPRA